MRLELPTHTITYTNGVNYKIPIYWELWRNGQIIKTVFGPIGGMYNDISEDNYNNHPDGSSIEAEIGFNYAYTFKFWHLGTINLPIMLIMFAGDSPNTNNRSGMYDGDKAFSVQMGEYKQFDFILVNNPENWVKINCNAGFILADGSFTYNIPAPITLKDVVGGDNGLIIPKLEKRLRDNTLIEWYNLTTGVATGARIPNTQLLSGVNNPFYIEPVVIPPPTNLFYNFNAGDYFDTNNNPAVRSPIFFIKGGASIAVNYASLIKDFSTGNLTISKKENGYLLFQMKQGVSVCIAFKNPLLSKAGVRIKGKKIAASEGLITIKSNAYESVETTTITNNLDRIIDYTTTATVNDIFIFIEQTNVIANEVFEFETSIEFYCENTGEIIEPYVYREEANLFLGDDLVNFVLFESITSTIEYTDLNTIPTSLWQPSNIIQIPNTGIYHIYGRFTLANMERKVFKIRSFTQS